MKVWYKGLYNGTYAKTFKDEQEVKAFFEQYKMCKIIRTDKLLKD